MTHRQSILEYLSKHRELCDDCVARQLGISRRQSVNSLCRKLPDIVRIHGACGGCSKVKILNTSDNQFQKTHSIPPIIKKANLRSLNIKNAINQTLITAFSLEERDYCEGLEFTQFLKLKQGLARIHDAVTLKLTFELVSLIVDRFDLSDEHHKALLKQVDSQSANASGFDVFWDCPQIIAEVKGCIPMNGGNVFGSAQFRSLTNDLRQMLSLPSQGKTKEGLSPRSKVHRQTNKEAIKLLALYDCPEVRKAAKQWKQSVESKGWFRELSPAIKIEDAPAEGPLKDTNKVYLVYLLPRSGL